MDRMDRMDCFVMGYMVAMLIVVIMLACYGVI